MGNSACKAADEDLPIDCSDEICYSMIQACYQEDTQLVFKLLEQVDPTKVAQYRLKNKGNLPQK